MKFVLPVLILGTIALIFGLLLAYLGKKLAVKSDPLVDDISSNLSQANCGACGFAGCNQFAKALAEGKADLSSCSATSIASKKIIANLLGVEVGGETVFSVACQGGDLCNDKFSYLGYRDCNSATMVYGGAKECKDGCLGLGSCIRVCNYRAITINSVGFAEIDKNLCVNCGNCVNNCPRKIIIKIPADAKIKIACSSCSKGKDVINACKVGCIGCGLCAKVCPNNAIEMKNSLPVIDYSKCSACMACLNKCPRRCIVSLEKPKLSIREEYKN